MEACINGGIVLRDVSRLVAGLDSPFVAGVAAHGWPKLAMVDFTRSTNLTTRLALTSLCVVFVQYIGVV